MTTKSDQHVGIVYLACPYTHVEAAVRLERFEKATRAAAYLIRKGCSSGTDAEIRRFIGTLRSGSAQVSRTDQRTSETASVAALRRQKASKSPAFKRQFEIYTLRKGHVVYSPITMTHPIDLVLANGATLGSDYWVKFDEAFLAFCSSIVVLRIDGWDRSSGVRRELEWFSAASREIDYLDWHEVSAAEV